MPSVQIPQEVPQGKPLGLKTAGVNGTTTTPVTSKTEVDIIDIRRAAVELNLKAEVLSMFSAKDGPRQLPTLLLYDERGLQLFEKVRLPSCLASTSSLQNICANLVSDHVPRRVLLDQ